MASSILLSRVPSSLLLHICLKLWEKGVFVGKNYTYKMFTFFLHSSSKAFVKSTETALVPFVFINNTLTIKPAQK